ncbi:unnamed protein product [Orchesella dallaii]|uniref:Signal recognition particle receptor subunit beta n=1 Tax=Orchesella dallaii TaxID=48710 RepID=A0ABP1RTS4_9HEXA
MSKQERGGGKPSSTPPPGVSKVPLGSSTPIWNDPMFIPIVIAVALVLLTILFLLRRKSKGRIVLLVGPTDVGKSSMFSQIVGGKNIETVTSVTPNEGEYIPSNGRAALTIKDLPGHERVRIKFWDESKVGSRGIVCVVDASGGNKAIRESAEIIYTVLTDPAVTSVRPNILIFANKQDAPLAKAITVVKTQLERELTTLRMTKSAGLTSIGGGSSSGKFLGKMDKDFEFAHAAPLKVEFAEGSCNLDKKELALVTSWLDTIA